MMRRKTPRPQEWLQAISNGDATVTDIDRHRIMLRRGNDLLLVDYANRLALPMLVVPDDEAAGTLEV